MTLTYPIKVIAGIVLAVATLVGIFYAYSTYDKWQQRRRQEKLAAAAVHVATADTLVAQADTQQVQILPTKRGFNVLTNSPQVRSNPVARTVADTAKKIIKADSITIATQKKAIANLDSAVKDLQDAGPPVGPRAVPYGDLGYAASSRSRAVPVVRLGVDYRVLPHVFAKVEVGYQPPPAGDASQKPELRILAAGHITFR